MNQPINIVSDRNRRKLTLIKYLLLKGDGFYILTLLLNKQSKYSNC